MLTFDFTEEGELVKINLTPNLKSLRIMDFGAEVEYFMLKKP